MAGEEGLEKIIVTRGRNRLDTWKTMGPRGNPTRHRRTPHTIVFHITLTNTANIYNNMAMTTIEDHSITMIMVFAYRLMGGSSFDYNCST